MSSNRTEQLDVLADVMFAHELLNDAFTHAYEAADVLTKELEVPSYSLALSYWTMAHSSFREFRRFLHEKEMDRTDFTPFQDSFEHLRVQLFEVVSDNDSNTSWLNSSLSEFAKEKDGVDDFLKSWMKDYTEQ